MYITNVYIYIFIVYLHTLYNISIISSCLGLGGAFGALAKGAGTQGRQKDQQAAGNGIVRGRQMSWLNNIGLSENRLNP